VKRLIDQPEWKELLQPLADERLSKARLDANLASVRARIAVPGPLATAASSAKLVTVAKLGIAVGLSLGVATTVAQRFHSERHAPATLQELPAIEAEEGDSADDEAGPTSPAQPKSHRAHEHGSRKPHAAMQHHASKAEPSHFAAAPSASPSASGNNTNASSGAAQNAIEAPAPVAAPAPPPPAPEVKEAPPPPPERVPTPLEVQLALFREAKEAAKKGDFDRALGRLDELDRRFPAGPLAPEVTLARADYLARAERIDDAIAFITQTVKHDPPKRAELYRLLGDLWRAKGECSKATPAYEKALSFGAVQLSAKAAKDGIEACRAR
jgi:tetratricopeptide (TPR) repeat protein